MTIKAMIFAAGMGSRLRPITDKVPKALVKVKNKPLLQYNIERLQAAGIYDIVINVHYKASQVLEFLDTNQNFGVNVFISDESDKLLDTGGGLKKASDFLSGCEHILLQNVDIYSNINYKQLLNKHIATNALATLAVRNRKSSRYFLFDENLTLSGWKNVNSGEQKLSRQSTSLQMLAFSGIHVVNSKLLSLLPDKEVFGMVEVYLDLAKKNTIQGYLHDSDYWFDIGTVEKLAKAESYNFS